MGIDIILLIAAALFGIIGAMISSRKGEWGTGFLLGFLLGPIGVLLALFMRGNRKECCHCRALIHKLATVCSHCGREQ